MAGQTPQIKESERAPIDLSINPLRRREQKSKLGEHKVISSKISSSQKPASFCEEASNTSAQTESSRPKSGFRIRDQNGVSKYSSSEVPLEPDQVPVEKGQNKVEKYFQEKNFVKKIGKGSIKVVTGGMQEKPMIKKLAISKKTKGKNMMLPPLEGQDEAG